MLGLCQVSSLCLNARYGALPVTRPYPGKEAVRAELGQQFGEKLNSQLEDQL